MRRIIRLVVIRRGRPIVTAATGHAMPIFVPKLIEAMTPVNVFEAAVAGAVLTEERIESRHSTSPSTIWQFRGRQLTPADVDGTRVPVPAANRKGFPFRFFRFSSDLIPNSLFIWSNHAGPSAPARHEYPTDAYVLRSVFRRGLIQAGITSRLQIVGFELDARSRTRHPDER